MAVSKEVTDLQDGVNAIHRNRGSMRLPQESAFLEVIRPAGLFIGSRWFDKGDVVAITPNKERRWTLMPVDDRLFPDRARELIKKGYGKAHSGPATHSSERPSLEETIASLGIETASLEGEHKKAERATSNRQKAGAL